MTIDPNTIEILIRRASFKSNHSEDDARLEEDAPMIGQASTSFSTIAMTELHRRLLLYVALSISKKVKVSPH
jgi:hypothetical protein